MNYDVGQMNEIYGVLRSAEVIIKERTGLYVKLEVSPVQQTDKKPTQMIEVICRALRVDERELGDKTRKQEIVWARHITIHYLRKYYTYLTLKDIGLMMGGLDHTTVINSLDRVEALTETRDSKFMPKYYVAEQAIKMWLSE